MIPNLLIYGGTFDPLHNGHLKTALAVQNQLGFQRFIFLPCKAPVLKKTTTASCEQRIQMLERGLSPYPLFEIDLREIKRDTPSFMVDTLLNFREELGTQVSITLLIGMDAFLTLPQWHAWQTLLTHCHLLVMQRPQTTLPIMPDLLCDLLTKHEIFDKTKLLRTPFGKIYQYNAGEYPISSSLVRQRIKKGESIKEIVPDNVYQYILKHKIYETAM